MTNYNNIRYVKGVMPLLVLPLLYDDSLSYYEQLSKVYEKVNELIDRVNSFTDDYKSYTDAAVATEATRTNALVESTRVSIQANINDLKTYVDKQDAAIMSALREAEEAIYKTMQEWDDSVRAEFKSELASEISSLRSWVLSLIDTVNTSIADLKDYSDAEDDKIRALLASEIDRLEGLIHDIVIDNSLPVIDPCDNTAKSVQSAFDNMWFNLRSWAATAFQYDSLMLSAEDFDSGAFPDRQSDSCVVEKIPLKAYIYDYNGYYWMRERPHLLHIFDCIYQKTKHLLYARNPFTGAKESIKNVLYSLCDYIRSHAITAASYDAIELGAAEPANTEDTIYSYDPLELTAYEYDWFGYNYLNNLPISDDPSYQDLDLRLKAIENAIVDVTVASFDGKSSLIYGY